MKQLLVIADLNYSRSRIPRLIKHLPQFGWQPTILGNPHSHYGEYKLSSPKLQRIRPLLKWLYKPIKEVTEYPDKEKHWQPPDKLEQYDAILSSSAPVTTHIIAKQLRQRLNTPWIADLRDLWTQNINYPYSPIRHWRERKLEVETLKAADALVTTSEPWAQKLHELHGKPAYSILNSYDPDEHQYPPPPLTRKFTVTYTGQIYKKAELKKFLKGVVEFWSKVTQGLSGLSDVDVRFYGPNKFADSMSSAIKCYGTVSHEEALMRQQESQLLLLLKWDTEDLGLYTGKVFEYLGAQRPVLAVGGKPDVLSELIEETNVGVNAYTVDDVATQLARFYQEYKRLGYLTYRGKPMETVKYTSVMMARKFSSLLSEVSLCKHVLLA